MNLSDYRGPVSKCGLCLPNQGVSHVFCQHCFDRGYVALCLNCDGKGKTVVSVGGSVGTMESTCNLCGGKGHFPASKEAYLAEHPDAVSAEEKEGAPLFPEVTNSEKQRLIMPETVASL